MEHISTQLAVIGGGASGLAAALTAARNGCSVLVLERLPRIGKKLLLTGNGRCNLSNTELAPARYHGSLPQAAAILSRFQAEAWFRGMGLYTTVDSSGRMYPRSNTAASVLDALRFACMQAGVTIRCDAQVTALRQEAKRFLLRTQTAEITASKVIFAAGGYAAPACGTDGTAMQLLRQLGHTIRTPRPALCPIPTDPQTVRSLKGIRVHATVTALQQQTVLGTETGEVQFADGALSGICIFNLARYAAQYGNQCTLRLSLCPDCDAAMLGEIFAVRAALPLEELLTGLLPKRVGQALLKSCTTLPLTTPAEAMPQTERALLLTRLHAWDFPVTGAAKWQAAQVTAGGIPGTELTDELESRRCNGLYLVGEAVDVDGDCGGYNLAWAWASGICAGTAAARRQKGTT